jgi:DNA-binding NarL/FixJ family response regulator
VHPLSMSVVPQDSCPSCCVAETFRRVSQPFFTATVSETLLGSFLRRDGICLSDWERTVVQLIAEGHSNRQVAKMLQVSRKTVETKRRAIMRWLNLPSAASIVLYAIRNGLVEP